MARTGRKRKEGPREANGKPQRRNHAQSLTELAASERRKIQAVVLNQPHRRGDDDKRLASAIGRFCKANRLRDGYLAGAEAYATTRQRWAIAMGKPFGFENVTLGGTNEGPTDEQVKRWKARVDEVDLAMRTRVDGGVHGLFLRLVIDDIDMLPAQAEKHTSALIEALAIVGYIMGCLEHNPHPYRA